MLFHRHIGIDYSGAETADSSLKGLRVFMAENGVEPVEVPPPPSPRKYWTRRGLAHWLAEVLEEDVPTLVGIDHGFSFPLRYFEAHGLEPHWDAFLVDFQAHWPTDERATYVDFVREGVCGDAAARTGSPRWRRLCEERTKGAKSVFHFDVTGQVAKSTHAGLPWLLFLRRKLGAKVRFWPFDGWEPVPGRSMIAEVYPALWKHAFPPGDRDPHQHDAYCAAAWIARADREGQLMAAFTPSLTPPQKTVAEVEGWILGVA